MHLAQRLLEAESAYVAKDRQLREDTGGARAVLVEAERNLKAVEAWAVQVSREEVFH